MVVELTLYGRSYCHLCDDMKLALKPFQQDFQFVLHEVDVDSDPELENRLGEWVPALFTGRPEDGGQELCHYFLDSERVRSWLDAVQQSQPRP